MRCVGVAAGVLLCSAGLVAGQAAADPALDSRGPAGPGSAGQKVEALTVAVARQRARDLGATAAVAAARAQGAAARVREARASRWPHLEVKGRYARLSDVPEPGVTVPGIGAVTLGESVLNQVGVSATVRVPLYTGLRLQNAERAAQQAAQAARDEAEMVARQLEMAAEMAYWRLYQARRGVGAVEETVRLVTAHRDDVARLRDNGLVTADAVLEAEVRLSEARVRRVEARHRAAVAQAALSRVACLPLEREIALADTPAVQADEPLPVEELRRRAAAQRPDLAALDAAVSSARRRAAAARGERLPAMAAEAAWDLARPNSRYFPPRSEWHDTWLVGVGVEWSVWDAGLRRARVQRAEAEMRQTEALLRDAREAVAHEVLERRLAAVEAGERAALARQTVTQATEHERQVRARFEAGAALSTEVLDAEVALERARLSLARARADECVARAALALAVGEEAW